LVGVELDDFFTVVEHVATCVGKRL
jgi:hypothetical protein